MKYLKKIMSFEPFIIWSKYFLTVKVANVITNFGFPLLICILLGIFKKDTIESAEFDVFSISSILVGFCSAILIMLLTLSDEKTMALKQAKLKDVDVSLYQALIYKFSFIVINLLILIFLGILAVFIGFNGHYIYRLIEIYILVNTLFTLIEALTNVMFCLISSKS